MDSVARKDTFQHAHYMRRALAEARRSPPKPTNFCVGACLVDSIGHRILATGYTLECEGNTHAEEELGEYLPEGTVLYTTMEPCNKRSIGNMPCVDRILRLKKRDGKQAIQRVYIGVSEPETLVGVNEGKAKLEAAGIELVHVPGFEDEIFEVATAGHVKEEEKE